MKSNRNWNLEFNFLCLWLYKDMKPLISCSCSSSRSVIFLASLYSPLTVLLEDINTRRDQQQQQHNKASALFSWCDNNIKHQKYWGRHNDVLPYIIRRSEIHFFQHLNKASPDYCVQVAIWTPEKNENSKFILEACPKLCFLQSIFKIKPEKKFLQSMPCGYSKLLSQDALKDAKGKK